MVLQTILSTSQNLTVCKVIHNDQSKGPVKAKNQGLKIAKGEYIMFHDSDDIMNDGALFLLYNEISENYGIYAVEAKIKDFISPDMPENEKQKTKVKPEPYYGLFTGAILIRKSAFDKIGLFNESVKAGEIIDWRKDRMDKHGLKNQKSLISFQQIAVITQITLAKLRKKPSLKIMRHF